MWLSCTTSTRTAVRTCDDGTRFEMRRLPDDVMDRFDPVRVYLEAAPGAGGILLAPSLALRYGATVTTVAVAVLASVK